VPSRTASGSSSGLNPLAASLAMRTGVARPADWMRARADPSTWIWRSPRAALLPAPIAFGHQAQAADFPRPGSPAPPSGAAGARLSDDGDGCQRVSWQRSPVPAGRPTGGGHSLPRPSPPTEQSREQSCCPERWGLARIDAGRRSRRPPRRAGGRWVPAADPFEARVPSRRVPAGGSGGSAHRADPGEPAESGIRRYET
jgi:hypothetical protein